MDDGKVKSKGKANVIVGVLVAAVLAAAVVAMVAMGQSGAGKQLRAVVHDGEGAAYELPLAHDAEQVVRTSLGTNVVVVKDGAVYVREADCDNQDCVHQGSLSAPGRQIICLPHKLWVEVVAAGERGGEMDVSAATSASGDLDVVAR